MATYRVTLQAPVKFYIEVSGTDSQDKARQYAEDLFRKFMEDPHSHLHEVRVDRKQEAFRPIFHCSCVEVPEE